VGGWTLGGNLSVSSGSPFRLTSNRGTVNAAGSGVNLTGISGVVLQGGLTADDLQKMIKVSPGPGFARYWIDPKLIGPDGRANPQYLAPPTTPGDIGQFIYLYTPNVWNLDASLSKRIAITQRVAFTFTAVATSVLNHPVWGIGPANAGVGLSFLNDADITSTTFGQTLQPATTSVSARQFYLRGEISF
jgi:hypothetical protein